MIDSLIAGCSTCVVSTVDADVVVILVGKFHYSVRLSIAVKIYGWNYFVKRTGQWKAFHLQKMLSYNTSKV